MILRQKMCLSYGSTWQHCHVHGCVFSNLDALLILNGNIYCAQMKQAQNSDSETHVENLNQTSRTDLSRKSLSYIFLGHPVVDMETHFLTDSVLVSEIGTI